MRLNSPVATGQVFTFRASCLAGDLAGDVVSIAGDKSGGLYPVEKVSIDDLDPIKSIAVGVISKKLSPTVCMVMRAGILSNVYSGLPPGRFLFVGEDSRLTSIRPANPTAGVRKIQIIGRALSSTDIAISILMPIGVIPA